MGDSTEVVNLVHLADELMEKARASHSGRAARSVHHGHYLRLTMVTLTAAAELAEHEAPPEATISVVTGTIELLAGDRTWTLQEGDVMPIPQERHSVTALVDASFVLTIRTEVPGE